MSRRRWNDEEYIIALYLYKYGFEDLGIGYTKIGKILNRTPDAIIMRFANFLSVENNNAGLSGGGKRTRYIYNKYNNFSKEELRKIVMDYLFNITGKR
ncbi:MAG: hypothetical protein ACOCRX_10460 [Candidatus Woesearchaeota archaeon]